MAGAGRQSCPQSAPGPAAPQAGCYPPRRAHEPPQGSRPPRPDSGSSGPGPPRPPTLAGRQPPFRGQADSPLSPTLCFSAAFHPLQPSYARGFGSYGTMQLLQLQPDQTCPRHPAHSHRPCPPRSRGHRGHGVATPGPHRNARAQKAGRWAARGEHGLGTWKVPPLVGPVPPLFSPASWARGPLSATQACEASRSASCVSPNPVQERTAFPTF